MKVGRNDLCPCGSGKKFKQCHLARSPGISFPMRTPGSPLPPGLIRRASERLEHERKKRDEHSAKYGEVLPIMHVPKFQDKRLAAGGAAIYPAPERGTFTNF